MDKRIHECPGLKEQDIAFLRKIEAGMAITADVSRADMLLCCLLAPDRALILRHTMPKSTASLYRNDASGRVFTPEEQPLLFRTFRSGSGGHGQKEVLTNGAPVIQDCYAISRDAQQVIAALVFETNMVAYERHRRRNRSFRQAVRWLQDMCLHGLLEETSTLSRFGMYDGVYLVDPQFKVVYMNGIAANMFRSVGIVSDLREQTIGTLEPIDAEMVEQAYQAGKPLERRHESQDGRIWIRKVIPLRMAPVTWQNYWQNWYNVLLRPDLPERDVDAVMVMVHNATEAVQKQRELNVKSAIIQEVHHRVKNNLQTIAAILRIQARRCETDEARQHLTEAVNRILSMSVIHEFLSQDEHRPINVREVCQRVANQVTQVAASPEQQVDIKVSGPNIRLPAGQATPTAMVINELLLNAVEHGARDDQGGRIQVELLDRGDSVEIVVEDNGLGLPPDFDPAQGHSLGLQIVHTLVTDDLKGEFRLESITPDAEAQTNGDGCAGGTRAIVTFPKRSLRAD
ncbi:MAG: histidine kinase N-terminal domain-containing protein [Caldilineaceae bacterium]|nr:histidine kinase N-terminal domain-containing protein [Caldilineaceae bacterium]MCB9159091.1 histidine kinase N-terminal domain-containing protein [Caldilineaceae bacterium]